MTTAAYPGLAYPGVTYPGDATGDSSPPPPPTSVSGIPVPILDIGFPLGAATVTTWVIGDWARGAIGTGVLGSSAAAFTEIALSRLISFTVGRGAGSVEPVIRYEAGTAIITLTDPDGEFDPDNLTGPYVSGGVSQVTPNVPVRLRIRYGEATFPLFYGYADSWDVAYVSPTETGVQIRATDAFKFFSDPRARVGPIAPTGAGESPGTRINRILDAVGWSNADRYIETGEATLAATTFEGSALDEMTAVADAELGQLFVGPSGTVYFYGRSSLRADPRSTTSWATFGSDVAGGELPYKDRTLNYGYSRLANEVAATATGPGELATQQVVISAESQQRYRVKSLTRDDLVLSDDAQALMWAGLILYQCKDIEQWVDSLDVDPRAVPDGLYPHVLGRDLGERITVVRRRGGAGPISRDSFIRGINHTYGPGPNRWLTKWVLQSATGYSFFTIGDTGTGIIGTNALA